MRPHLVVCAALISSSEVKCSCYGGCVANVHLTDSCDGRNDIIGMNGLIFSCAQQNEKTSYWNI